MLFEQSMMKYLYSLDYDGAFTTEPILWDGCDHVNIGWGERNRIGDSLVKQRVELVLNEMLPATNFSEFLMNLDEPERISGNWCLPEDFRTRFSTSSSEEIKPDIKQERLRPYL